MTRKKIDNRIRVLIENCVSTLHRSLFVVVGAKARDQVVILYQMLTKAAVRARPNVLWCYKKELGFSTHRKKRMRQLKKKFQNQTLTMNEDDPFEVFIGSTNIRYCYYNETHQILGQTFGALVIQDFEALTPNLLARTVETVEGGGLIVILLQSLTSLKQLYTMSMDVHARYRTEAHQDVVCRFNERFILSLSSCANCLVVDDKLNILPISSNAVNIKPVPPKSMDDPKSPAEQELYEMKDSFQDTQPMGVLIGQCKTLDQAKAVLKFLDALSEKTLRTTVTLTSGRGRGKSAALGLAIAGAIAFSYSNIFVTSPSPENLKTLFSFVVKGLDVLGYENHLDYEVTQSTNSEFNKAVVRVSVSRDHRQTVQYIHPGDAVKLGQAELVVIDEAAAIPLPFVKNLLGPYLVFLSSTINGYEGTGRSLSLKLINQLRQQAASVGNDKLKNFSAQPTVSPATGRTLHEVTLSESIRYQSGDSVEAWLNRLLCLDAAVSSGLLSACPEPLQCELYYISRDTLFSHHKVAEAFLHRIVALFVASHYKNSPNDLLMMSDAPAHHLFCLLPPLELNTKALPEVLSVVQVCLEGQLSKESVVQELSRGKRSAGDLIPWTISQQFQDQDFPTLSGARIVRIATHPDYQRMGYGLRTLQLLQDYYEGKIPTENEISDRMPNEASEEEEFTSLLEERLQPRKSLAPLLLKLTEKQPEKLDYMGVSYGLTAELLRFWKKAGFVPVYLRQTPNDLTGEHSCIMLKALDSGFVSSNWLPEFFSDFKSRYIFLLSYQLRNFVPSLALSVLTNTNINTSSMKVLTKEELQSYLSVSSIKRLEMYCQNLVDYHLIVDLMPTLAKLYFLNHLGDVSLTFVQTAILLCLGLQHKTVDQIAKELELSSSQILGLFSKAVRHLTQCLKGIVENSLGTTAVVSQDTDLNEQISKQELEDETSKRGKKEHIDSEKPQGIDCDSKESENNSHKIQKATQKSCGRMKRMQASEPSEEHQSFLKRKKHSHEKKLKNGKCQ